MTKKKTTVGQDPAEAAKVVFAALETIEAEKAADAERRIQLESKREQFTERLRTATAAREIAASRGDREAYDAAEKQIKDIETELKFVDVAASADTPIVSKEEAEARKAEIIAACETLKAAELEVIREGLAVILAHHDETQKAINAANKAILENEYAAKIRERKAYGYTSTPYGAYEGLQVWAYTLRESYFYKHTIEPSGADTK